ARVARNLEEALKIAPKYSSDIWIIGGGQVYKEALEKDIPDRLYISEMRGHWEDDSEILSQGEGVLLFTAVEVRHPVQDQVVTFPRVNWEYYKALYIDQCDDHTLKILSKTSLNVL
ncbi:hypothetical protein LCGC14_1265080, partial [marine sediment metagenome]|nr:hypothetical protein [Candidatus Aminicenantes bacterium]